MNYKFKTIQELTDLCGKKILLRLDFNVPMDEEGDIRDDYRIRKSLKTIDFLRHAGAKVIIIAHIESEAATLKPIYEHIKKNYPEYHIQFTGDILEEGKAITGAMKDGSVLLSENIRLYDGEKKNDAEFSKKLASLGDIYINDAFSVSHRKHASIVGIPKCIPGYAGFQFIDEVSHIAKSFNPDHPFLFILGGAKFDTKLPLITKFLDTADNVFIGGALAHNFYKENGEEVGVSLVSDGFYDTKKILESGKIVLPEDFVVFTGEEKSIVLRGNVKPDQKIVDAGPQTIASLKKLIDNARFILWNGPVGGYEQGYMQPTQEIAEAIADKTKNSNTQTYSVVGGGDTLAAIAALNREKDFSFVSTGGGAMLDLLANETLPGIEALEKSK